MSSRWIIEKDVSSDWFLCKGNEISVVDTKKCPFPVGRRINVMLNEPSQLDQQSDQDSVSFTQWKFSVRSVAAIGLTIDQSYGPGYSIKGFIYDSRGNLRSSGTDLVTQFGDKWPEASEIVLITNEYIGSHLKIWIIQDHRPLGLALTLNYPLKDQLKPFLTFNKPGKCLIHRSTWKGNLETIERSHYQQLNGSIIGYWQLAQFNNQTPLRPHEATIIRRSDYMYELIMSGWNNIDVELMFSKGSVFRVKNRQKTTLGGPDEFLVEERRIFGAFVGTININLTENGMKMIIKTDQVSLKFNRWEKVKPNPIDYDPFVKSTDHFLETEIQ